MLRKQGFNELYQLRGGIMAWQNANLPLTTEHKTEKKKRNNKVEQKKLDVTEANSGEAEIKGGDDVATPENNASKT